MIGPKALFLLPVAPVYLAPAVFAVSQQGAADFRHGDADLMGPARQKLALHQRQLALRLQGFIIGNGAAPAGDGPAVEGNLFFSLIL
ncbi:hypothetical protein SDC9_165804 [bioreactor metagenome]|uniref:Uncharacterized protein n=1 Tax=bioreactor metagenome TaxID=1076179 RepID=A0A645G2T6_9ZZZZ